MRIVCYTCITKNYDMLNEISIKLNNIDFICFSDSNINSKSWNIVQMPTDLKHLSCVLQQRIVKICPHKYLKDYDLSIWIDGNISVIGDLNLFILQYDIDKIPFYTRIHPTRNCIYDEALACIYQNRGIPSQILKLIEKYKSEGYPLHIGMAETNIILRKHNDKKCIILDNNWATELLSNSHRDLLSFNYVCWKNKFIPGYLVNEFKILNNKFFTLNRHNV